MRSAFLRGGALYLPALAVLIAIGVALYRMQPPAGKAMFAAAAVFVLSFAFRTLDNPICTTFALGTHFMWHILNAVLLFLLVRVGILYARVGPRFTPPPVSSPPPFRRP